MKARFAPGLAVVLAALGFQGCAVKPTYEPAPDREGIREVVRRNLPQLESCYLEAIDKRPGAEGKITLEWEIGKQGEAIDLRTKAVDPKITDAVDCVKAKVQSWKFPAATGDDIITVTYPFVFSENQRFEKIK